MSSREVTEARSESWVVDGDDGGDRDLELMSPVLISVFSSANSLISSSMCISSAFTQKSCAGE